VCVSAAISPQEETHLSGLKKTINREGTWRIRKKEKSPVIEVYQVEVMQTFPSQERRPTLNTFPGILAVSSSSRLWQMPFCINFTGAFLECECSSCGLIAALTHTFQGLRRLSICQCCYKPTRRTLTFQECTSKIDADISIPRTPADTQHYWCILGM
jgi:hypothetical protein